MRMWHFRLLPYLCKKHLIGIHGELHKFKPSFEKQFSITKRLSPITQIEPKQMKKRHDQVVKIMKKRGYNHKSPYTMPDISYLTRKERNAKVDYKYDMQDLINRCPDCAYRIQNKIMGK